MKKLILIFIALTSLTSWASGPRKVYEYIPDTGLPGVRITTTQFVGSEASILYSAALEVEVLCANGEKHPHKITEKNVVVDEMICRFWQPNWDGKNIVTLIYSVPNMNEAESLCTVGRTVDLPIKALARKYCNKGSSSSAP